MGINKDRSESGTVFLWLKMKIVRMRREREILVEMMNAVDMVR